MYSPSAARRSIDRSYENIHVEMVLGNTNSRLDRLISSESQKATKCRSVAALKLHSPMLRVAEQLFDAHKYNKIVDVACAGWMFYFGLPETLHWNLSIRENEHARTDQFRAEKIAE